MSGGRFNYQDMTLKDEIFGYAGRDEIRNVFEDREITELIYDVFDLIHDYDWYASGDTCEGTWNKAKKEFKAKWLTPEGQKARYDKYINDTIAELKSDLGLLGEAFCYNCENFEDVEENSQYGKCKYQIYCMMHKYDNACVHWKGKNNDND